MFKIMLQKDSINPPWFGYLPEPVARKTLKLGLLVDAHTSKLFETQRTSFEK